MPTVDLFIATTPAEPARTEEILNRKVYTLKLACARDLMSDLAKLNDREGLRGLGVCLSSLENRLCNVNRLEFTAGLSHVVMEIEV